METFINKGYSQVQHGIKSKWTFNTGSTSSENMLSENND